MRVLVTGASGFVGRRLLPRLEAAGHSPIASDQDTDITCADAVAASLRRHRPDAIVHLAAMSSVADSWREPARCFALNWIGTRNLLQAVQHEVPAARVLLIGSGDQYGTSEPAAAALTENCPLHPRSPYARTKASAELLGACAAAEGLDVVRIRAFNHTGAGQPDHFVVSNFARQIAAIRAERQPPVMRVGNLESVRDFLHVDDVLEAYLAALNPGVPASVYNVASERATTIREVLDRLMKIAGIVPTIETDPDRWRPTDWLVGDAARFRAATGWCPRISLPSLLEELYHYWAQTDA